jgi:hypothetical protein
MRLAWARGNLRARQDGTENGARLPESTETTLIAYYRRKVERDPERIFWQHCLQYAFAEKANYCSLIADYQGSAAAYRQSVQIADELHRRQPQEPRWLSLRADLNQELSMAYRLHAGDVREKKEQQSLLTRARGLLQRVLEDRRKALELDKKLISQIKGMADAYRELASLVRLSRSLSQPDEETRRIMKQSRELYQKHLDELTRYYSSGSGIDPLEPPRKFGAAVTTLAALHSVISTDGSWMALVRYPEEIAQRGYIELWDWGTHLYALMQALERLDPDKPTEAEQGRWLLRRGLHLLGLLQRKQKLPAAWETIQKSFVRRLKSWPRPGGAANADPALDQLDYHSAIEQLAGGVRKDAILDLLIGELKSLAVLPVMEPGIRDLLIEALLPEPETTGAVLQAARSRLQGDSEGVPAPTRKVLAELARLRGDDPSAFALNAKVVEQGTGTAVVLRLGPVLRERGQMRTLARMNRSWWERQTRQMQDSIAAWNEAAWDALNAADLDAAADAIQEVRRKAPNEIQTRVLEAYLAYQKRDFRATQKQLKLLREDAKLNDPWKWIVKQIDVLTRHELGEKIDIDSAFPTLPATNPLSNGSNINRIWLQMEQGQKLSESLAAVLKSLSERPRSATWNYLHGVALLKNGQAKEAVAVLEKLRSCESTQRDPAFWLYLGEALMEIGQRDNARMAWEQGLAVFPSTTARDDRRRQQIENLLNPR